MPTLYEGPGEKVTREETVVAVERLADSLYVFADTNQESQPMPQLSVSLSS